MSVDEIYETIAKNLTDGINEQWAVASFDFEHGEGHGKFDNMVYKENVDDSHGRDLDINYEVFKAIMRLHEITTADGRNKWNRMHFALYNTGKFDIKFKWDQVLSEEK